MNKNSKNIISPEMSRKLCYSRIFSHEFRQALHSRRLALGLSYTRLADFLGVNWGTVRKWEQGLSLTCNARLRPKLAHFLAGEVDTELKMQLHNNSTGGYPAGLSGNARRCLDRLTNTYLMCAGLPELQDKLASNIRKATNKIIYSMASNYGASSPKKAHAIAPGGDDVSTSTSAIATEDAHSLTKPASDSGD